MGVDRLAEQSVSGLFSGGCPLVLRPRQVSARNFPNSCDVSGGRSRLPNHYLLQETITPVFKHVRPSLVNTLLPITWYDSPLSE